VDLLRGKKISGPIYQISIAGSLKVINLEKIFPGKITRIMPTVISEIDEGITLVYHNSNLQNKNTLDECFNSDGTIKEGKKKY
jgi:pyrroline-5-carboxylate reductase